MSTTIKTMTLARSQVSRRTIPENLHVARYMQNHSPLVRRTYATQTSLGTTPSSTSRPHKRVTLLNDDGHVKWGDLSPMEKVARTTQQSMNFTLVIGGAVMTIAVFTLLYTDVFSPQSSVSHYNHAVDRIRTDPRCIELLGPSNEIAAYGEPTWNKWRRNRAIASTTETDKLGTERLYMHFNLSGPLGEGVAHLHMQRRHDEGQFHYGYLAVDVRGHPRVYVENAEAGKGKKAAPGTFLGIRWT